MKNEILDFEDEYESSSHSTRCFKYFLNSFSILVGLCIFYLIFEIQFSTKLGEIVFFFIYLSSFLFNLLGLESIFKSIKEKEEVNWEIIVGGLGNLVLTFFFIYSYYEFNFF